MQIAPSPEWPERAVCKGMEQNESEELFFPAKESAENVAKIRERFCNLCPVFAECLADAIRSGGQGLWAGTSTDDRNKLRRVRARAKCPVCKSPAVIPLADTTGEGSALFHSELCTACSVSWPTDRRPDEVQDTEQPDVFHIRDARTGRVVYLTPVTGLQDAS